MHKSTWLALVVFVGLVVGSVYTLTRKPERGITHLNFSTLDTASVDKIEVVGQTPIVLVKKEGTWRVPGGREADKSAVEALLTNTKRIRTNEVITQDSNKFTEFEVDAAKGRDVSLYAGNQKVAQFVVGKYLAGGPGGATAMLADNAVYKVRDVFTYVFAHSPMDWTERHLFTETVAEVLRLNVQLQGQSPYTLVGNEKGWDILEDSRQPKGYRFDKSAGKALADSAVTLQAQELLDTDPGVEVTKLDASADKLTWFFTDAAKEKFKMTSRTLTLGASREDKQVYAKVEGHDGIFTLAEYAAKGLRKNLENLRDLTVLNADPAHVVAITIDDGKNKVVLERTGEETEWQLRGKAPAGFVLDPSKVTRRIAMAAHVRGTAVADAKVSPAATGLKASKASVTLTNASKEIAALKFGNKTGDGYYATGNMDSETYIIGAFLHDQLLGGLDTFKRTAADSNPLAQLDPKTLANLPEEIRTQLQGQLDKKKREQQMLQQMQQRAPH